MFLVGLTGGIGSGKTTVSSYLQKSGIPIIDADLIARQIVEPHTKCWKAIREYFGEEAINSSDNQINRAYIARIIFSDPEKRKVLNQITHPEIQKRTLLKLIYFLLTFRLFVVLDVPLLFESSIYRPLMSYIVVVKCTGDQQMERIQKRNGYSNEEATNRIAAQMPLEEKCRLADFVIDNSGSLDETLVRTQEVFQNLKLPIIFWIVRLLLIGFYTLIFCSSSTLLHSFISYVY